MLRLEEGAAGLQLTSRLARPRVLVVLAAALLAAAAALRAVPPLAWGFAGAALLLVLLGGRAVRASVRGGRIVVRPAVPLARAIAAQVGITYRGVQRILGELEEAGYLTRTRARADARSNEYRVDRSLPLRHPLERHQRVAAVLDLGAPRRASPG